MNQKSYICPSEMRRIERIHFVGIGGSGMCGIAEVLLNLGYEVTGSDIAASPVVDRLIDLGALVWIGHQKEHVIGADVVVISTAVKEDNPEVISAKAERIPIIQRAQMLGELMRFRFGIAVAGTHGKTTTTSLLASILDEAGLDPTYVIGGRLNSSNVNARLGLGQYLVAEADESDASFLHLHPMSAIITNIDQDHMSTYGGDIENLRQTFVDFLHLLPFYGLAVLCIDNEEVASLIPRIHRPIITYGESEGADYQLLNYESRGMQTRFEVKMPHGVSEFTVALPGKYSVLNSLAAIAIANDLGVPHPAIRRALRRFKGIGRRFQFHPSVPLQSGGSVEVMEDYGHHPTEIQAVYEALTTAYPEKRIIVAFQPHRNSRTAELYEEFLAVLSEIDTVLITDIYSVREPEIPGISGKKLAEDVAKRGGKNTLYVGSIEEIRTVYAKIAQDGDLIVMMGAGNIGGIAANFYKGGAL
ncbi:UDP-N-acetylmuramate--L-alanine ligase [Ignatzschineria cameli]|uniref:UDP-N-acetylmuramate--L-alanine ligase n=1 Tax=Ignatzschineria cameli TaxID=2182793 RepID=A0A2U2AS78_9GAMM|nr:UDP-N-acetylmuramate--L-alanine ligase [Ignatzschineria cameli]PWD86534.1 UDP-N-acetylmuramate--L-alanine ligase [Ignatzschineria cameli]PWD87113.1 UDP-N-acetylmuramate--L-alanine ligase [Ignatzschineria cameli]PWD92086.1 UDP-N-acetylmuramate--L-alanine ligase [Ignatzschineria cameli]PWD93329.1 UDP-N-acetylmuramate--L-alanine ligase [Ignatzschineria cameli]PWD94071.1 UDP-N-acetylmuramate--L-alanine ligase [Ignatzschineria cameli]